MPRAGYDDEPTIRRVRDLMASNHAMTRHAAIKSVVGDNRSNIRRIEQKMASADALKRTARSIQEGVRQIPPAWDWSAMARPAPAARVGLRAHWTALSPAERTALSACALLCALGLVGRLVTLFAMGAAWLGLVALRGAALLGVRPSGVAAPIDAGALPHWGGVAAWPLPEMHVDSVPGPLPVTFTILSMGILAVALFQRLPSRASWREHATIPAVLALLIGVGAAVPILSDVVMGMGCLVAGLALRGSARAVPMPLRLPLAGHARGVFQFGADDPGGAGPRS